MSLKECSIYRYAPDDIDPFEDDDEGSIWSINYFFFNKTRKRVCYVYLRGLSALSHSAKEALMTPIKSKRFADDESDGWLTPDLGARKRAKYWLGDRAKKGLEEYGESDELDNMVIDHPGEIIDNDEEEWQTGREASMGVEYWSSDGDSDVESLKEREISRENSREKSSSREKSNVRAWSEGITERMEL